MHFQITHYADPGFPALNIPGVDLYNWKLERADGTCVARSCASFDSEKAARSDIAQAKKSMKGAGRCKVLSP